MPGAVPSRAAEVGGVWRRTISKYRIIYLRLTYSLMKPALAAAAAAAAAAANITQEMHVADRPQTGYRPSAREQQQNSIKSAAEAVENHTRLTPPLALPSEQGRTMGHDDGRH